MNTFAAILLDSLFFLLDTLPYITKMKSVLSVGHGMMIMNHATHYCLTLFDGSRSDALHNILLASAILKSLQLSCEAPSMYRNVLLGPY